MNRMFFAGTALAALAAAGAALAQPADRDELKPGTRAAVEARVEARFARADADRDGYVTQDEARARAEARRGVRMERRGERRAGLFDRLDADHDGAISRAEFEAGAGMRGERRAMRGERRGPRFAQRRGAMMGGFGARAFAAMDANKDGRVALAEARSAALARFDRVDLDRDGTIGPEERNAAREAFRKRLQDAPAE